MRGQASIEALLIIAAVTVTLAVYFAMGQEVNETSSTISAARIGAENAITALVLEYGDDIGITKAVIDGDNVHLYLSVQGTPPPDNSTIISAVRENALNQGLMGYGVSITLERVTR